MSTCVEYFNLLLPGALVSTQEFKTWTPANPSDSFSPEVSIGGHLVKLGGAEAVSLSQVPEVQLLVYVSPPVFFHVSLGLSHPKKDPGGALAYCLPPPGVVQSTLFSAVILYG